MKQLTQPRTSPCQRQWIPNPRQQTRFHVQISRDYTSTGQHWLHASLLLQKPYANESSQICPFQKRSSPKSQVIFAFVFSWICDFFVFLGLIFFKLRRVCVFLSLTARGYVQPLTTEHCGSVHYITIGNSRLLTAAGLTRSPLYLIGDAASRCGLSRVGYFIPFNGRRPLNGHPPSL